MDPVFDRVRAGDLDAVRAAIKGLPETDRRRLAKPAIEFLRQADDVRFRMFDLSGIVPQPDWPHPGDRESVVECARVLVLATITPSEFRKHSHEALPSDLKLAVETLLDRSVDLNEFVEAIAEFGGRAFALTYTLVRAGKVEWPTNPGYVLHFIRGLEHVQYEMGVTARDVSIYGALKADPSLLEHEVWGLFEVEGGGETSLATFDKYRPDDSGWASALTRLSAEGHVSRARLLDASLAALRRDFAAFRAGWFSRFHERLGPTRQERRERIASYIALISSPIPATVSFAIRALAQAGGIPDQEAERLGPALEAKAVTAVKSAVKLLPKSQQGARVAAGALSRAARAAQPLLLEYLERIGDLDENVRQLLAEAAGNIAPSLRERLQKLLGAQSLPDDSCGIDAPAATPAAETELAAPVESLPELIELLTALLERIEDAHDLERALDGVSRFCDRSDETLRRLQPLARRAQKLRPPRPDTKEPGIDWGAVIASFSRTPRRDMADLVHAWATGEAPALPPLDAAGTSEVFPRIRKSVLGFLSYRVLEVAVRAAAGVRQPILSLPTAPGGAIERRVLELRRQEHARLAIQAGTADAIQAAMRAGEVPLPPGLRLEYGCTMMSHTYEDKTYRNARLHVRVQPPFDGEPRLDRVPELFLASLWASELAWLRSAGGVPFEKFEEANYCGVGSDGPAGLPEAVRWAATVWPEKRELYYAAGAVEIGQNINWWEARWHARHFMEPLLLPGEPIGEMARLLLAVGLGAKEAGERTLATDVLIAAVTESRLDCTALGSTLGLLYGGELLKGGRLAVTLADAGRVSTQHSEAAITIIESVLAGLEGPPPADLQALLGALSDLLAATSRGVSNPNARIYLSALTGSNKAAVLAKSLMARTPR